MWLMGFRNTMLTVKKKQSDSGQTELYIFHRGKRMAEFGRRKERERAKKKKKNHNTHLDILRTRPAFFFFPRIQQPEKTKTIAISTQQELFQFFQLPFSYQRLLHESFSDTC